MKTNKLIMWLVLMKHVWDSSSASTWRDGASQRKEFIVKQIGDDSKTEVFFFFFINGHQHSGWLIYVKYVFM